MWDEINSCEVIIIVNIIHYISIVVLLRGQAPTCIN